MTPQVHAGLAPARGMAEPSKKHRMSFAPYVLALVLATLGLRGVPANNIVDTDAARHAMNGAFVRDLLASGEAMHPIQYGNSYFAHLPALSMPYHPPMFPVIESIFFWILDVNVLAARIAVALAVAISVFLFYRLILATGGSHFLAVCVIATFFSWSRSQDLASDVMLEFPALAFSIGALYCLRDLPKGYPLRRGLAFALLAGAAVWTKQHAVFLGVVPFAYVVFARRWRLLAGKTIWISSFLFGLQVVTLSLLALPFKGTGVDQVSPPNEIVDIFVHNLGYYVGVFTHWIGVIPFVLLVSAFVADLLLWRGYARPVRLPLYAAWAFAAFLILLVIGPFEDRYLFFAVPALLVLAYSAVLRILSRVLPAGWARYPVGIFAALVFAAGLRHPVNFMHGPAEMAAAALEGNAGRVLYCGDTDGSFIFAVRSLEGRVGTIVIAGDKLPPEIFDRGGIERFAEQYGVSRIVLEKTPKPRPWDRLYDSPTAAMTFVRDIPLSSSHPRWNGNLRLYRFLNPSVNPERRLNVPIPRIGTNLDLKF